MKLADWRRVRKRRRRRLRRVCRERWRTRAEYDKQQQQQEEEAKNNDDDAAARPSTESVLSAHGLACNERRQNLLNNNVSTAAKRKEKMKIMQEESTTTMSTTKCFNGATNWPVFGQAHKFLVALLVVCSCLLGPARANSDANRLFEDLMMSYNRIVRPVQNNSDRVVVHLGLKLFQLMDVNLKDQIMTINVWLSQEWYDYKLKWDPSEYGGIEDINLPAKQIWLPDIVLYNSAEGFFSVSIMTKAKVRYDGHVIWNPPAIFRSSCQIDVTYFPFDSQNCHLKFGSWTFGNKLDLKHINDTEELIERGTDLTEYYQNVEWDIMQATARRNVITYICCPNDFYPDVTFNFKLRRKPLFYTVNLILPCIGITFFSFLVFYLPSDSGEKVTLTISILVSLIFFLSVLIETIPSTSLAMPLLGKYIVFTLILITLSVCATVCVLNIHFRTPSTHHLPQWIKRWCMDILPKYLLMSVPQYRSQTDNILPEQLIYLHNQAHAAQYNVTLTGSISATNQQQQQQAPAGMRIETQRNALLHQQQSRCSDIGRNGSQRAIEQSSVVSGGDGLGRCLLQHQATSSTDRSSLSALKLQRTLSRQRQQTIDQTMHELDPSQLMMASSTTTNALSHLRSEAAHRSQAHRSRSLERDKSSQDGGGEPTNGGELMHGRAGTSQAVISSNLRHDNLLSPDSKQPELERQAAKIAQTRWRRRDGTKPNKIWNFFKLASGGTRSHAQQQAHEQQELHVRSGPTKQQKMAAAPARSSTASGFNVTAAKRRLSSVSGNSNQQQDDEPDDDYQHHRHFQARASICSNNLWRIGPTRRCSLAAVPLSNYPTYYRPLAQLQQSPCIGGGHLATISGQCLPTGAVPLHYHVHGEESIETDSSSASSSARCAALGTLVTAATSNLVMRPKQQEQQRPQMETLTSGGFIENRTQLARSVSAMPPRHTFDHELDSGDNSGSSTSRGQSETTVAAPPPPLPISLKPEFSQKQMFLSNKQQPENNSLIVPGQLFQHSSTDAGLSNTISATRQNFVDFHDTTTAQSNVQLKAPAKQAGHYHHHYYHHHHRHHNRYQQQRQAQLCTQDGSTQLSMPRSKSIEQRLSGGAGGDGGTFLNAPICYHQEGPMQTPGTMPSASRTHSIGRALGHAYVQRLQKQPNVYSPFVLARNPTMQQHHQQQQRNIETCRPFDVPYARTTQNDPTIISTVPASIDMLRRSRSQTSLGTRGAQSKQRIEHEQRSCDRETTAPQMRNLIDSTADRYRTMEADSNIGSFRSCNCTIRRNITTEATCAPSFSEQQQQRIASNNCNCAPVTLTNSTPCKQMQQTGQQQPISNLSMLKLITEVDKAIQNAMFIAQHIDNLDEFESVKENWKYIAMVIDRIFLLIFLFACIFGTVTIFALVPWTDYLFEKPIDLQLTRLLALNLTSTDGLTRSCHDF